MGSIPGSGFICRCRFGDHFGAGDHFRVGIISAAVESFERLCKNNKKLKWNELSAAGLKKSGIVNHLKRNCMPVN